MLDFTPVQNREKSVAELADGLTVEELRRLTNEMVDRMLDLVAECDDADVTFVPSDPDANDTFASDDAVADLAWTLGHVIVHTTASSEEAAAVAAELARGVGYHGRSRSEVPWESVTTIAQCRHRLEESRRMRLASLDMWPDQPTLDQNGQYEPWPGAGVVNSYSRFILGLYHDDSHLAQLADIVRQARAKRAAS